MMDAVTSYTLRTMGAIDLRSPDGRGAQTLLRQPKRLALFAFLATRSPGQWTSRESLAGLFWADSTDARARNALAQSLHVLRKELGADVVVVHGAELVGIREGGVHTDVHDFREFVDAKRWEEALDVYGGDFLSGFHVPDADGFERWLDEERRELRTLAIEAAWQAAAVSEKRDDLSSAIGFTRRGVALTPFDEVGCRYLMALLAKAGDRVQAIKEYEDFADRLGKELGIDPSGRASAASDSLRGGESPLGVETPLEALGPLALPTTTTTGVQSARDDKNPWGIDGYPVRPGSPKVRAGRVEGDVAARNRRLMGLAAVGVGVVAVGVVAVFSMGVGSPPTPVVPGTVTVAMLGASNGDDRVELVSTEVRSLVSQAPFAELLRAGSRPVANLSDAYDGDGAEWTVVVGPVEAGQLSFSLLGNESRRVLVSASMPVSVSDSVAADRIMGAITLHLDRTVADWGGLSSVLPRYGAVRAFIESMRAWREHRHGDSMDNLRFAVQHEGWFPLAMLELAQVLVLMRTPEGDSLLVLLAERRSELSEFESLFLQHIEARLSGERHVEFEVVKTLGQLLPERFQSLAASLAVSLGDFEAALRLGDRVDSRRSIIPNADFPRVGARHSLGLHLREYEIADSLRLLNPEVRMYVNFEVAALSALGRLGEIESLLLGQDTRPRPSILGPTLSVRALVVKELITHGFESEARSSLDRGLEILEASPDSLVRRTGPAAWFYRQDGQLDRAREIYLALLEEWPESDLNLRWFSELGLIEVERGNRSEAVRWAARIAEWSDEPGAEASAYEAVIHTALGDHARAIGLVRQALQLGLSHISVRSNLWELQKLRGHAGFDALFPYPTF